MLLGGAACLRLGKDLDGRRLEVGVEGRKVDTVAIDRRPSENSSSSSTRLNPVLIIWNGGGRSVWASSSGVVTAWGVYRSQEPSPPQLESVYSWT